MRLPFTQVTMELIEQAAPDLAALLERSEAEVLGGLVFLHKWALGRCPEDEPPSANDVVEGPAAAKLIARAARVHGDAEAFVDACEQVRPALLERVAGGVRVRGLDRYDATWRKNRGGKPDAGEGPPGTGTEPGRDRNGTGGKPPGTGTEPARKTQTQTQIEKKIEKKKPPPPTSPSEPSEKPDGEKPEEEGQAEEDRTWEGLQAMRAEKQLGRETKRPTHFAEWCRTARAEGIEPPETAAAYGRFLRDKDFEDRVWPTAVFITEKVWRPRLRLPGLRRPPAERAACFCGAPFVPGYDVCGQHLEELTTDMQARGLRPRGAEP